MTKKTKKTLTWKEIYDMLKVHFICVFFLQFGWCSGVIIFTGAELPTSIKALFVANCFLLIIFGLIEGAGDKQLEDYKSKDE